ncbi:MAG TPA: ASKHA domain-containing protein [Bacteroidales bacterium]|nr:ASKHA domain-containing protein [Bacteroidales bacterium]
MVVDKTPLIDVLHLYGIEFPCGGKGTCGKCKVKVLEGNIEADEIHMDRIKKLGLAENWRLACFSACTGNITLEIEQFEHLILSDESSFTFKPLTGFGVVVDLGTTTIVGQIVNLKTSEVITTETTLNPQVRFGADLISRIDSSINGHAREMTNVVRTSIESIILSMLAQRPVPLRRMIIVGNTAMQYIFSGLSVRDLSAFPFEIKDQGMKVFQSDRLDWSFKIDEGVKVFPPIGSFVGTDILSGIFALQMHRNDKITALIDLGTNGEIAIGNKNGILCASTAAGPAFEGSRISMGMRAVTGAISSMTIRNNEVDIHVIGNVEAKGICGSALIDAVSIFRKRELIDEFGIINSGLGYIPITEKVVLTQRDIQEFLLAKAAIATGLEILADKLLIKTNEIDKIFIAGGFGNFINIDNVIETEMINSSCDIIEKRGNTALLGAKMLLYCDFSEVESILSISNHVNLEGEPTFNEKYVCKLKLKHL